ncbi:MAG: glycosyltransferase, partial [Anaerolineae bacterium]|nr:glycosyltransferase [Anaerolineae bacterium]
IRSILQGENWRIANCELRIANGERLNFQQNLGSGVEGGVLLEVEPFPIRNSQFAIRNSPILALQDAPNRVTIHAVLDTPGYLMLADTWYPGWQATVDGEPAEVLQANYAFRAVRLGAGEHVVEFVYRPRVVMAGMRLSVGLLVCWLVSWLVGSSLNSVVLILEVILQVSVIVPTYNEQENIESLVARLLALPVAVCVIVVDDNSPDGTGAIADRLAAESDGRMGVIHRAGKLGLGTAYVAGFKRALAEEADLICTMDADFSHNPRYIPAMVDKIGQGYDLVIGSRYVRGGGASGCIFARKLLSWGANAFARTMLGLRAHDTTAGFRCYRREVLRGMDLDDIKASGYSFLIEMLYRVQRSDWRVGEVPIVFENRRLGASKVSKNEIIKALGTVLRLAWVRLTAEGD